MFGLPGTLLVLLGIGFVTFALPLLVGKVYLPAVFVAQLLVLVSAISVGLLLSPAGLLSDRSRCEWFCQFLCDCYVRNLLSIDRSGTGLCGGSQLDVGVGDYGLSSFRSLLMEQSGGTKLTRSRFFDWRRPLEVAVSGQNYVETNLDWSVLVPATKRLYWADV